MENIQSRLAELIAKELELDVSAVPLDRPLSELGVDSLEMVEIITLVEDEFDVRFDDKVLSLIESADDLLRELHLALSVQRAA